MRRVTQWVLLAALTLLAESATTAGRSGTPTGWTEVGVASFFAHRYRGQPTANGGAYSDRARTAAHRTLTFGTRVRVTSLGNDRSVVVTVTGRGPFVRGRVFNIRRRAAQRPGFLKTGASLVRVEVLPGENRT